MNVTIGIILAAAIWAILVGWLAYGCYKEGRRAESMLFAAYAGAGIIIIIAEIVIQVMK